MGRGSKRSRVGSRPVASRARARCAGSYARVRIAFAAVTAFAALAAALLPPGVAAAEAADQVKAAFLFNFARYVEWPASAFAGASAPIRLCLIAERDFEAVVDATVSGRRVGERPVQVEGIHGLAAAKGCHLLFLGEASGPSAPVVVEQLGALAIFTISDAPGFAAEGGIANFILVDSKIRFEINPSAARRAGLKISSSLLRLAKLVGEEGA